MLILRWFATSLHVNAFQNPRAFWKAKTQLLNSDFMVSQAGLYARKLLEDSQSEENGASADPARVRSVFQACFQRLPSEVEVNGAMDYLVAIDAQFEKRVTDTGQRRQRVWQSFCQAMLMTNGELQFGLVHHDLFHLSKFPEICFQPKIIKNNYLIQLIEQPIVRI